MQAVVCTATQGTLCALHLSAAVASQACLTGSRHQAGSALDTAPYLRELEDVFLAVDDLEALPGQPGAHIPGVEPPLLVDGLPRLLLVLVVPLEDGGAPHANLYPAAVT